MPPLPKEILEGYNNRYKRRFFGANPSTHKVKCPTCKAGKLWRYSDGAWSKCDTCGWGGAIKEK